ncbi:MAG: hypothetical protein HY819_22225 [Acidobacteria bacterium]|nr:hypothetical protein [Acidobacteriota bacterium]
MKFRIILCFLLLLGFSSLSNLALASSDPDVTTTFTLSEVGPTGGDVRSLAIDPSDPNRLYLGTGDGQIYRSTDSTKTWVRLLSFHHPGYVVDRLIVDKKNSKTIYVPLWSLANDEDGAIYKTTDGGDSWQELTGMKGHSVRALALAPTDSNFIIAAAIDGAFRSLDAGTTWERITPKDHTDLRRFHSIAIDKDPNIIYLGTEHLPWRTDNGGKDWVCIKGHPTEKKQQFIDDSDIFTILIDSQDSNLLFASACSGIYTSSDRAATWTKFQGIPFTSRRTHTIYPDPTNNQVIYSGTTEGLWKSINGGQSWRLITSLRTVVNAVAIHPSNPNKIYVGIRFGGVLVSDNGGDSFIASNKGFINRQISVLLADRSIQGRVYAAALFNGFDGGLYLSTDGGKNWQLSSRGLASEDIYTIYQSPWNEKLLYAGTNLGLYVSVDRGESWSKITSKLPALAITPSPKPTPNVPATGKKTFTTKKVVAKVSSKTKKLPNATVTERVVSVAPNFNNRGHLVAAWSGLYQISETGQIEKLKIANYIGKILSVATDQKQHIIYAGTNQGLYRSFDDGKTWELVTILNQTPVIQAINVSPHDGNVLMVTSDTTCFLTRDGGKTWLRRGGGIPYGEPLAVRFSNTNPNVIVVGDYRNGGLYISTDLGESFTRLERQVASNRIGAVAFDNFDPDLLYVGSFSGGVYVLKTPGLSVNRGQ